QIIVGFDRDVDASTVNANTFQLVASGGDGTFGEANDVSISAASINVPGANPASAAFDLTGINLADDTYQVSLFGTGASVILDLDANELDGEYTGNLPSGDGAAGGNFIVQFAIATPVTLEPNLDSIQAIIFDSNCASCHSGPTSNSLPSGMDLSTADASYDALLGPAGAGVPSIQQPTIMRVMPNDPDNSYLIQKLEGTAATGNVMPPTGALDAADIAEIRQWIMDGALR
ncbi:MAG: hypothetical protein HKN77_01070, partial [Woeseiaceae bacterium]|nr:hypothetical protein [Woeseiaceae bacterium]